MFEEKDKAISEEIERLKSAIQAAKHAIICNDSRIDTLSLYPHNDSEIDELNYQNDECEKTIAIAEKKLLEIAPLQSQLDQAKKEFENYKDLIDFATLKTEIESLQEDILNTLKRN